jgi:hypothetical protein
MYEKPPTAAYYRKTAEDLRDLADKAQVPEVRRDLLQLAERFDRLAEFVEKRDPTGRGRLSPLSL